MTIMETIQNAIQKRKAGRPFGAKTVNRFKTKEKYEQKHPKVTKEQIATANANNIWPEVGDFAVVNLTNDPWHGFKVTILELHDGWAVCCHMDKTRSVKVDNLNKMQDGLKTFIYDK